MSGQRAVVPPVAIVSLDSHVAAPVEAYRPFVEPAFLDRFDEFVAQVQDGFARSPGARSAFLDLDFEPTAESLAYWREIDEVYSSTTQYADPVARLANMDADGVVAEVAFHGGFNRQPIPFLSSELEGIHAQVIPTSPEAAARREAGVRAYNRWLADWASTDPERLIGVAFVPIWNVEESVAEVARLRSMGLRAVNLPAPKLGLRTYNRPEYDPFWAACVEHDVTLHSHVGEGQMMAPDPSPGWYSMILSDLAYVSRRHLQHMIFGGVFERFPALRLTFTEQAGTWVKPTLEILDSVYLSSTQVRETPHISRIIPRMPSEYFATNVLVGASFASRAEVAAAIESGYTGQLMWGRDYPHPEGTWPTTMASLRSTFAGFDDDAVRAILGETATSFLGLDRSAVRATADRIGPSMADIQTPLDEVPPEGHLSLGFRKVGGYA